MYPIPDHIPVYPFAVEAWKLAARMGEKEDWSLVRVLTKLVRDCSSPLGYYTARPKAWQAMPSQAKRGQGITCPGSILMPVKRKKEGVKKGEVNMEWI